MDRDADISVGKELESNIHFYKSMIDSLDDQIAVVDHTGEIVFVNKAWRRFAVDNGLSPQFRWLGVNYLNVCQKSSSSGDRLASQITNEMQLILQGRKDETAVEYPCHSKTEQRWFIMVMRLMPDDNDKLYLISHRNITARKLAEIKAEKLSLEDSLTGLANRRNFDRFLHEEWRRCMRAKAPISLIMIDVDHFKQYNDDFGHAMGDHCLRFIADALRQSVSRPTDLSARFGGEEFAIVLGQTDRAGAYKFAENLRYKIMSSSAEAELPRPLTISLGVATLSPQTADSELTLIEKADEALYNAKHAGRNQTCCHQNVA